MGAKQPQPAPAGRKPEPSAAPPPPRPVPMPCCSTMPGPDLTERPTCRTCPYYGETDGTCHLQPVPVQKAHNAYCSYHPDMPSWIKQPRPPAFVTK